MARRPDYPGCVEGDTNGRGCQDFRLATADGGWHGVCIDREFLDVMTRRDSC